jgi:hypothetical protein
MQIPAAGMIESAVDQIKRKVIDDKHRGKQQAELTMAMGDDNLLALGAVVPITGEIRKGYELGLQTARVVLEGSPLLDLKDIKASDLL